MIAKAARTGARVLARRRGRRLLAAAVAISIALADATAGVSVAVVFGAVGLTLLLFAWGVLTGWGGVWTTYAADERRWVAERERLPLGRTRAGKAFITLQRGDHESNRGLLAVNSLLTAVLMIALALASVIADFAFGG